MEEIVDLPIREIDTSSIQQQMARNKELLQVKLMVRRPISQLIEQGILPPLRQSPVLYEQTKRLERARTEDYLKHKISTRPNRQQLIEHHILEDTNISPRLIAQQQQLKKAKLADNLNERLSHRPGPLELIKGNILLPSNLQIGQAVKQGTIDFKPTSLGSARPHPQPSFLILKKDQDARPGAQPATHGRKSCNNYHFDRHCNSLVKSNELNGALADNHTGLIEALGGGRSTGNETANGVVSVKIAELDEEDEETDDSSHASCSSSFSCSPAENDESCSGGVSRLAEDATMAENSNEPDHLGQMTTTNHSHRYSTGDSPGGLIDSPANQTKPQLGGLPNGQSINDGLCKANKQLFSNCSPVNGLPAKSLPNKLKKNKIKLQGKNKIIKFHEYKGPPNAIKQSPFNDCSRTETAYELLLQQQQLYLQLELEMQQKQQQLTNQQLANQRLQQQAKESSANKPVEDTVLSAPSGKEATSSSVAYSSESKVDEDQQPVSHASIINTSMVHTSMINSGVPAVIASPATNKTSNSSMSGLVKAEPVASGTAVENSPIDLNKIEEMKVNDLKQELKRCNLPISGSKTMLIERLKAHVLASRSSVQGAGGESMEIDSPAPCKTTSSPASSTQTNLTQSSSLTTFATLTTPEQANTAGNLLGATDFLTSAQNPSALQLKTGTLSPLIKAQTSLTGLKADAAPKPVQRRISEPQLQHIQLHFTNPPFLQFATAQPSLSSLGTGATSLTGHTNAHSAQQIHFLSTPTLNTNDLHLITQPLLNNRIIQPTAGNTASQPTTWTLQPTTSFPQLFFYPTQLATTTNSQGLLSTAASSSTLNLNRPLNPNLNANPNATLNANLNGNLNACNSMAKSESFTMLQQSNKPSEDQKPANDSKSNKSSSSDSISAATGSKAKKASKSSKGKANREKNGTKTSESNRKTSISSANSYLNGNPNGNPNTSLKTTNSTSSAANLNSNCPPKSAPTIIKQQQQTNYAGNSILEKKNETNYPSIEQASSQSDQTSQLASGSYLMNPSMMNGFHLTNLNVGNLGSYTSLNGSLNSLIIDKPPPNYEEHMEATKQSNSANLIVTSEPSSVRDYPLAGFSGAPTHPPPSSYSSVAGSQVLSYERIQRENTSNTSTNLISSSTVGTSSTKATGKPATLQQCIQQSSSAEFVGRARLAFRNADEKKRCDALNVETDGSLGRDHQFSYPTGYSNGCNVTKPMNSCGFVSGSSCESFVTGDGLMSDSCATDNPINGNCYNGQSAANTNNKPETNDFSLDFDLLMEDLTDFPDFDCGNYASSPSKSNNAMEIDKSPMATTGLIPDRLTINTDFDPFTITEQSLHTPTLEHPQDPAPFHSSDQQILAGLIDNGQSTNSMIFDQNINHNTNHNINQNIDHHDHHPHSSSFTSNHPPTFATFAGDPFPSYSHSVL